MPYKRPFPLDFSRANAVEFPWAEKRGHLCSVNFPIGDKLLAPLAMSRANALEFFLDSQPSTATNDCFTISTPMVYREHNPVADRISRRTYTAKHGRIINIF